MKMTGQMEWRGGVPVLRPNDTFNLPEEGCYVSYNNHSSEYGCDTTALVRMNGINPTKFLILNGNHTKEYAALGNYDDCVEYFKQHLDQKNKLSENWDEEIITRPDGTLYVTKIPNDSLSNYFSEWFYIISKDQAKRLWDANQTDFLILSDDKTDRYANCFDSWEEIEKAFPDALFGLER